MPPVSFKSDESFLKKLAVGAAGTKATICRLNQLGFWPIELERGSSGFKIWKKIKIKRVRVPDILCLKSGWRFESRGKTKLEISMSHSLADPNRAWDAGMRPDDFVVVILCEQASDEIIDWRVASPIHFIRVKDMRAAFAQGLVNITKPKGVEEGSEIRVIWPSVAAKERSVISDITPKAIKLCTPEGQHAQRCVTARRNGHLLPLCKIGDTVERNQIVAAVVPVVLQLQCPEDVGEQFFRERLKSVSLSERYAAAKALRFRGFDEQSRQVLLQILSNTYEDIYVRLEAAAALAAQGYQEGWDFLKTSQASEFEHVQLETIIVLSEIRARQSQEILIAALADNTRHEEIRAGAAWALGEFHTDEAGRALAQTFDQTILDIKVEAARALLKIAPDQLPLLLSLIKDSPEARRDGLAWVLARQGGFDPADIITPTDDNLRRWVGYILGYGKDKFLEASIKAICHSDPAVYFSASVLWQLLASWIYNLKEY